MGLIDAAEAVKRANTLRDKNSTCSGGEGGGLMFNIHGLI